MFTTHTRAQPFTTTTLGSARIGPRRELKKAIEGYWNGTTDATTLAEVAAGLRRSDRDELVRSGMDSVAVNTFSYYDQVLDTAVMLGALPPRFDGIDDPLDRYFAAARGNADVEPLEMTKWFDTNYHYLVPEIGAQTQFSLHPEKVLAEVDEAAAHHVPARPVVIGPATFLALSKATDGTDNLLSRIDELVSLYRDLLTQLAERNVTWVQIDEPILVTDLDPEDIELIVRAYERIAAADYDRPAVLLATYFGDPKDTLAPLTSTPIEGFAVDLTATDVTTLTTATALSSKLLVAGIVDGRNVWRTDLEAASAVLASLMGTASQVAVSTSCSTLHVPYTLDAEQIDPTIRSWLAFADDKRREVAALSRALRHGRQTVATEFDDSAQAVRARRRDPRLRNESIRTRVELLTAAGSRRGDAATRHAAQQQRLNLPALPTTTIGSYPQTSDIRRARAQLRSGAITFDDYQARMRAEIDAVIELQEKVGLDVLVHGEPERNDMVQYFADQLDGFLSTANGWVQSYGTRCVRPPIIYGDVVRQTPITVDWITYAQSKTAKPVKGMLTGPVTIIAWSFVRDDQPLADTANQVALAIRDETVDLQGKGIAIIQVDEPALRELMPLRTSQQADYLTWSVEAFRLATSGVTDDTQIHTHLCYSEFGEVIDAIASLDADVTSIEAARSKMEVVADLDAAGFTNAVGPGVYDIHSPRIPTTEVMAQSLAEAAKSVGMQRLWVNPDCGLKTRTTAEVTEALANMVAAAHEVRSAESETATR